MLLLGPRLATAAEPLLAVDLDGDGTADRVTLHHTQPDTLEIWLSATNHTQTLAVLAPLHRIVAIDLDGDRQPEIVATSGDTRLHVWQWRRGRFKTFHPRAVIHSALYQPRHRRVDDKGEPSDVVTGVSDATLALALAPSPRAPDAIDAGLFTLTAPRAGRSFDGRDPVLPRPPPPVTL